MKKLFVMMLLLLTFGVAAVSAQEDGEEAPLLEMLARIPAESPVSEWLTYIDYDAVIAARPGAPSINSWQEFNTLMDGDSTESDLLMSALMSYQSGPGELAQYLMSAEDAIDVLGFDLLAVDRGIEYGQPPGAVTILEGDFDTEAILSAFAARDYTSLQTNTGSLTHLCPPNGCDTGLETNLAERDPANIFGGSLGRSQPALVGAQWIASSTNDAALTAVANASNGTSESLADVPEYRAIAEGLSAKGTVLQAYFINPLDFANVMGGLLSDPRMSPEMLDAIRERLAEDFTPMPPYSRLALAQVASEDEDLTVFALTYADEATAEKAAPILLDRIENYTSLVVNRSLADILDELGVTAIDTEIVAGDDVTTLLLTLHTPFPDTSTPDGAPGPTSIGLVYRLFARSYLQRDLGWLAPQFE